MGQVIRRAHLGILGAALALAGCATASQPGTGSIVPPGARYVAMGSSFAAGPGLGTPKPGTPARCSRSPINYATLLATRLGLTLVDETCGGAMTRHVLGPWSELPAQIDAVTADTRLVTVTIGGNDINYVGGLIGATCRGSGEALVIEGRSLRCPPTTTPTEADYARLETAMHDIARQVAQRAPQAKLVFVEYVALVPQQPCAATPMSQSDADISRAVGDRLAAITDKVAAEAGALVLKSAFSKAHDPCSAQPWSNGFPRGYKGENGAPWHPNAAGMASVADGLMALLTRRQ